MRPGRDAALFAGVLQLLIERGFIDRAFIDAHTVGFDAVAEYAATWPLARTAEVTGVPARALEQAAELWGTARSSFLFHARGIEHHSNGVQNCLGTINLVPATGRIGKPKSGCGTIVGTANGQGGREHGQKCDQLPGWRDISNPEHRRHIASVWKIDERDLPGPGVDAYELIRLDLSFSQAADNALIAYARPGNVRELRNVVERAVLLWPARVIELAGDVTLEALEREHIQRVLARTATLIEAARILGIDTSTLYRKRKRYEQS